MSNANNGLNEIFAQLLDGTKTVEQVKEELSGNAIFLRAGRNYKALEFDGFGTIKGNAVTCYKAGKKVDKDGASVASKPRASGTGRKKKTA